MSFIQVKVTKCSILRSHSSICKNLLWLKHHKIQSILQSHSRSSRNFLFTIGLNLTYKLLNTFNNNGNYTNQQAPANYCGEKYISALCEHFLLISFSYWPTVLCKLFYIQDIWTKIKKLMQGRRQSDDPPSTHTHTIPSLCWVSVSN